MNNTALLVECLLDFARRHGLVSSLDVYVSRNTLLDLFGLAEPWEGPVPAQTEPAPTAILDGLLDAAAARGLFDASVPALRVNFEARIMGAVMPRESEVCETFRALWEKEGARAATDYFYGLCIASNYIRTAQIARNIQWNYEGKYGTLEVTINLTKPEKDPKAIAAARLAKQGGYPKCLLCVENEGYAGRINHPARQNHRIIPLTINGSRWGFQYSPYVYYNEHCIVFNGQHTPMKIEHNTFVKLFDFVKQFPHYMLGSNADLPIVGGSILSHDHFQGGRYEFPMAKAPVEKSFTVKGFEDVQAGIVNWPMSVIRISGPDTERLIALADVILDAWRSYSDEASFIFAETEGEKHNTITPIARKRGDHYELDLVLRNNITTKEHPLGVFHPHANLHHIKKENIGLIEVMGLAVLPARLKKEMAELEEAILCGADLRQNEVLAAHADWAEEFLTRHSEVNAENIHEIVQQEIGLVFMQVLEDAGVYKCTEDGRKGFERFIDRLNA